jgi:hypothetical protein
MGKRTECSFFKGRIPSGQKTHKEISIYLAIKEIQTKSH